MTAQAVDAADPAVLSESLAARLCGVLGEDVEVTGLSRLTGGASRETWSFRAGGRRLILRRDPPGIGRPEGMALEAAAIGASHRHGVPVPRLIDSGTDPAVVGAPYLVTEHVDGETIARRLLREDRYAGARAGLAAQMGAALAGIHSIPVAEVPGLERVDPLEHLRSTYDALGEPLPTIEIALRWLAEHRPSDVAETVVHGDFRTGNLIIDETGLRAVLDWEVVHRGDPREDLGWLCVKCWRFGAPPPGGGVGALGPLLHGHAQGAGDRPGPQGGGWGGGSGAARRGGGRPRVARRAPFRGVA